MSAKEPEFVEHERGRDSGKGCTYDEEIQHGYAGNIDDATPLDDKALMRKVDLRLIPWLSLLYLLSFLDRSNIGNAKVNASRWDVNCQG